MQLKELGYALVLVIGGGLVGWKMGIGDGAEAYRENVKEAWLLGDESFKWFVFGEEPGFAIADEFEE